MIVLGWIPQLRLGASTKTSYASNSNYWWIVNIIFNTSPFHTQQDRRHRTITNRKSIKNWSSELILVARQQLSCIWDILSARVRAFHYLPTYVQKKPYVRFYISDR